MNQIKEVSKIIRNFLNEITGIKLENIINGNSIRGPEMEKKISDNIYCSYDNDDILIIFTISSRENTYNDISFETDEYGNLIKTVPLEINLCIYGNDSMDLMNSIKSNVLSDGGRYRLYSNGIYLESCDNIVTVNEFKNGSMWLRNDMNINITIEKLIEQKIKLDNIKIFNMDIN